MEKNEKDSLLNDEDGSMKDELRLNPKPFDNSNPVKLNIQKLSSKLDKFSHTQNSLDMQNTKLQANPVETDQNQLQKNHLSIWETHLN